jgi:hypothetical protein
MRYDGKFIQIDQVGDWMRENNYIEKNQKIFKQGDIFGVHASSDTWSVVAIYKAMGLGQTYPEAVIEYLVKCARELVA